METGYSQAVFGIGRRLLDIQEFMEVLRDRMLDFIGTLEELPGYTSVFM